MNLETLQDLSTDFLARGEHFLYYVFNTIPKFIEQENIKVIYPVFEAETLKVLSVFVFTDKKVWNFEPDGNMMNTAVYRYDQIKSMQINSSIMGGTFINVTITFDNGTFIYLDSEKDIYDPLWRSYSKDIYEIVALIS
ncbi:hypothetical protein D3C74_104970 [compost metagenome]